VRRKVIIWSAALAAVVCIPLMLWRAQPLLEMYVKHIASELKTGTDTSPREEPKPLVVGPPQESASITPDRPMSDAKVNQEKRQRELEDYFQRLEARARASGNLVPFVIGDPDFIASVPDALAQQSTSRLDDIYEHAESWLKAAIVDEIKLRQQRITHVTGEYFPDMNYEKEHNAHIYITRGHFGDVRPSASATAQEMAKQTAEPTGFEIENTATTNVIGAQLTGANFDIEPKDIIWRFIEDGGTDTFSWKITPRQEGLLQLTVILRNKITIAGRELDLPVSRFPRTVTVSVDVWTKIGRAVTGTETAIGHAQKIGMGLAALFGFGSIGAAWAAIGVVRKRRNQPATAQATVAPAPVAPAEDGAMPDETDR